MIEPASIKVGDRLYDLVAKKWIEVCGCVFLVRERLAYVRSRPHEFAHEEPKA